MSMRYHSGELLIQKQAGTVEQAARIARGISSTIPPVAREFLLEQSLAVVGTESPEGRIWASPLCGKPGFLRSEDERTVLVRTIPHQEDPLLSNLIVSRSAGLLVIDLLNRRRMRLNGKMEIVPGIGFRFTVEEVFANCPKYIQARSIEVFEQENASPSTSKGDRLNEAQKLWIGNADTFFIATSHPQGGADASHRGGIPGFVRVVRENRLHIPDYSGNGMFLTLGNLAVNPHAGLLFPDFDHGGSLQLSGTAYLMDDAPLLDSFPGAERLVEFRIEEVIEINNHLPVWNFHGLSPHNPR